MSSILINTELNNFIHEEKAYFLGRNTNINWDDDKWYTKDWLYHRGNDHVISFRTLSPSQIQTKPEDISFSPIVVALPQPFLDFTKAVAVHFQRTRGIGFVAVRNYVNECRRLYLFMFPRNEASPAQLTGWRFEQAIDYLKNSGYKNIYDASANLTAIANLLDLKSITSYPIHFINPVSPEGSRHSYKSIKTISLEDDNERIGDDKLPSYEAMQAYAQCTNNPIDADEEILLRTIDLLVVMGQRCNEIMYIPYDCWVEYTKKDSKGNIITDANGKPIMHYGIRYYAEKQYQSTTHWLADQDIPFVERAVERLKILTKEVREIAKWQEENPNKLWQYDKDEIISDIQVMEYLGFVNTYNLYLYLKERNGIKEVRIDKKIRRRINASKKTFSAHFYRAGDIEDFLLPKMTDHNVYKEKNGNDWKTILKTSEVLSIRFEGAYRFNRKANTFKTLLGMTKLIEINGALGSVPGIESVFKRRNFTEADGSPVFITSHSSRHWRNTLYQLAGMSNINQALAMGRKNSNLN